MILEDVMDEIAARLGAIPSLDGRAFGYPVGSVISPAAVVPYPDTIGYDQTAKRGIDKITGTVVVAIGQPTESAARALAAGYTDPAGTESVKARLEAAGWTSCDRVRVLEATFDSWPMADMDMLCVIFSWRAFGPGH